MPTTIAALAPGTTITDATPKPADEAREPMREREAHDRLADRERDRGDGPYDERSDDSLPLDHEAPGDASDAWPTRAILRARPTATPT